MRVSSAGDLEHSGQQGPLSARLRLPSAGKLTETLVAQLGDFIRAHHIKATGKADVSTSRHFRYD